MIHALTNLQSKKAREYIVSQGGSYLPTALSLGTFSTR